MHALPPGDPGRRNGCLTKVAGHLARKHTKFPGEADVPQEIASSSRTAPKI
ncbi:primase C-terminal domain-containing protein [Streptomyces ipomoeae]|uniref:primase C-terminal domain-containing protein n=1 Tax=Streptomyces ipomoeae TaxID=103232 RepID=UPI0035A723F3